MREAASAALSTGADASIRQSQGAWDRGSWPLVADAMVPRREAAVGYTRLTAGPRSGWAGFLDVPPNQLHSTSKSRLTELLMDRECDR